MIPEDGCLQFTTTVWEPSNNGWRKTKLIDRNGTSNGELASVGEMQGT